MTAKSTDRSSPVGGGATPTDQAPDAAKGNGSPSAEADAAFGDATAAGPDAVTATLEADLSAERDRNLRLRAELENVRSRAAREVAETTRYAALPIVRDLLPVLDNIDRATEAAQKAGETGPLVEGVRMVRQQLVSVLKQHHAEEIEALGQPFDPQYHAAILHQPSSEVPADHVTMVTQAGYRMHDRVVRPSQVIVSSGPAT